MKRLSFTCIMVIFIPLLFVKPVSGEELGEGNGLQGTQWKVFVLQLPVCRNECGLALVSFHEEGEGDITWNNQRIEGLPFSYDVQENVNNSLFFTVNGFKGWGMTSMDKGIFMVLSSCNSMRCSLNYIIIGISHEG